MGGRIKPESVAGFAGMCNLLPNRIKCVVKTIADIFANIFFALLLIYGSVMVANSLSQTTPALGMSFSLVYLAIPVSAIVLLLNGIYNACCDFYGIEDENNVEMGE